MANGRIDRLERAFRLTGLSTDTYAQWKRDYAIVRRLLVSNPLAVAALNAVVREWRMDSHDYERPVTIPFLAALKAALEPYCDVIALADALWQDER